MKERYTLPPCITFTVHGSNKPAPFVSDADILQRLRAKIESGEVQDAVTLEFFFPDIDHFRDAAKRMTIRVRQEVPRALVIFQWTENA